MTPDMRETRRLGGCGNRFRRLAALVAALDCRNRLRQSLQATAAVGIPPISRNLLIVFNYLEYA
ncbi:hypothetical protein [Bordetella genomosp. 9]|nr:hypothetical protein [Bordetella genomosp. 9]